MNRKQLLIWGGIGAGGLVAIVLYRKHEASSSSGSGSADPGATDPLTGLPYAEDDQTDPVTGLTYLAEAQQYGSVAAAESAASGGTSDSGDTGYAGTAGYPTSNVGTASGATGSYATNAAWSQAVTAGLTGLGYSSTDIAAALGLFFAQQPLASGADGVSYASIIQAAEAEYGPPPQGTYSIISEPSSGGATGSSTGGAATSSAGSGTGAAPSPSPSPSSAKAAGAISNLQITGYNHTGVSFEWNAAAGATGGYSWVVTGNGLTIRGTTTATHVSVNGLTKPGVYNFGIQALPGGPGNNIHTPSLKGS